MLLLGAIIALNLGVTGMQAIFSYLNRDVFDALQAKNSAHFYHVLMQYGIVIVLFVPIAAVKSAQLLRCGMHNRILKT